MGLEATCKVRLNGRVSQGKAHCGDGELDFRGDFRFRWKWPELVGVSAADGVLTAVRGAEVAEFELGEAAAKWEHQIKNPKSRLDKFGLKPGQRYAAWGDFDEAFPTELRTRSGEPEQDCLDWVFVKLDSTEDLPRLLEARARIVSNGGIWAVWAKGKKELREDDIRSYALAHGLVDVKVASFSATLSALKLVIPVALR